MLKNIVTFNAVKLRKEEDGKIYLDLEIIINREPQAIILLYNIAASDDFMARRDDGSRLLLEQLTYVPEPII